MADNTTDCPSCEETESQGRFRFWCQRVLPAVYDDSLSYMELVCKLKAYMTTIVNVTNNNADGLDELKEKVDELFKMFEDLENNGFKDEYMDIVEAWLQENMWCILSWGSRIVWFGISDDGYFEAFIPDNFNFLSFDVIMDSESPDYGKLVLSYCQEVYEPCEISCWDADCPKPQTSQLPIMPREEAAKLFEKSGPGRSGCGCGSRKGF